MRCLPDGNVRAQTEAAGVFRQSKDRTLKRARECVCTPPPAPQFSILPEKHRPRYLFQRGSCGFTSKFPSREWLRLHISISSLCPSCMGLQQEALARERTTVEAYESGRPRIVKSHFFPRVSRKYTVSASWLYFPRYLSCPARVSGVLRLQV